MDVLEIEERGMPQGVRSQDDLKAKLYVSLQKRGILNSLKSQLRSSLITELQHSNEGEAVTNGREHSTSLHHQIAHYIITDHLKSLQYEYSLSTYLPEAGIQLEKLLSFDDVCQVLGLKGKVNKGCINDKERTSFLIQLLQVLSSIVKETTSTSTDIATQTDKQNKERIKEEEEREGGEERGRESIEKRMLSFQRECEIRHKRALEQEMTRFKDKELSLVRLEERNKYLKELTLAKEQIDHKYHERLTAANTALEEERGRLKRRESELEHDLYAQRQSLLNEMESLKMREGEMKRQSELDKRAASLEKEKTQSLQQLLSDKETVLTSLKEQYEQMAEAKVERHKVELQTKALREGKQVIELNSQIEAQQQLLTDMQGRLDHVTDELVNERNAIKELHKQLHNSTEKQNEILTENIRLQEKLKQSKAENQHVFWKERARDIEKQLQDLREQHEEERNDLNTKLAEQMSLVKEIKNKLLKSSKQHQTAQEQLKESKSETALLSHDGKLLREEIAKKTEIIMQLHQRGTELSAELQSSQKQIQELQEHIDTLHTVLTSSKDRSSSKKKYSPRRKVTMRPQYSTSPATSPSPLEVRREEADISFSDSSAQILSEARATFARLEKESQELSSLYNNYQTHPLSSTLLAPIVPLVTMTTTIPKDYLKSLYVTSLPMTSLTTPTRPSRLLTTPPVTSLTTPTSSSQLTTPTESMPVTTPPMTSSALPIMTSLVPPTMTSSALPIMTSLVPPTMTSSALPIMTSLVPPTMTSSALPIMTSLVPPTMTSSVLPIMTSLVPPTMTSSALPIMTAPPTTISLITPSVTSSATPIMTSSVHSSISVAMTNIAPPTSDTSFVNLNSYWNTTPVAMTTSVATATVATVTSVQEEDKWRIEREEREEKRKEREQKEREEIEQQLLLLQQKEEKEKREERKKREEEREEEPSESSEDKGQWTMKDYLQSVQQYNNTPNTAHKNDTQQDNMDQVEVLSVPAESSSSSQGTDPFENW